MNDSLEWFMKWAKKCIFLLQQKKLWDVANAPEKAEVIRHIHLQPLQQKNNSTQLDPKEQQVCTVACACK